MINTIFGTSEWCAIPGLNIPAIKARIDTGAKTSALHAFNINQFKKGQEFWLSFEIHPLQKNKKIRIQCESRLYDVRRVKSSNGLIEERFVIKEFVIIGNTKYSAEITLTNRDNMGYRMLIGRQLLSKHALINPSTKLLHGNLSKAEIEKLYGSSM